MMKTGTLFIPEWKSVPFQPDCPVFLYQLDLMRDNMGHLEEKSAVPHLGILFSVDLWEMSYLADTHRCRANHSFECTFKVHKDNERKWKARITASHLIESGLSEIQLGDLRHFHRVLLDWKNYWRYPVKFNKRKPPATHDPASQSCLFVPLKKSRLKTDDANDWIDWNLVHNEIYHASISLSLKTGNEMDQIFKEHIVLHRDIQYRVLRKSLELNATSPFPAQDEEGKEEKLAYHLEKYQLDLTSATFADYFSKKFRMNVQNVEEPLLEARPIRGLEEENYMLGKDAKNDDGNMVHLIPEFVKILPVPLSLLFSFSLAEYFVPELQRQIDLCILAHLLISESHTTSKLAIASGESRGKIPFVSLLWEATTVHPKSEYDRIEFLGDAVLGYFLGLNALACNEGFQMDCDDLVEKLMSRALKNKTLEKAGRRIKLENILNLRHLYNFRSAYATQPGKKVGTELVVGKKWGDCVESLLGSTYLGEGTGSLTMFLLDMLNLPFGKPERTNHHSSWLKAPGCCLEEGYPIYQDANISLQLSSIVAVLNMNPNIHRKLERGQKLLFRALRYKGNAFVGSCFDSWWVFAVDRARSLLQIPTPNYFNILLRCALFDDDLLGDIKDGVHARDTSDFLPMVQLRDTLYVFGHRALELRVSEEIYRRFPAATSGHMHVYRACCINDDVLSYIVVKNGIHYAFFDQNSKCPAWLQKEMHAAEKLASERQASGKFILDRYPGLVGGRLLGKKDKLEVDLTEELVVSFKAIVGAIAISKGVNAMWRIVGPLFDELLCLSPQELWENFGDCSSLISSYSF